MKVLGSSLEVFVVHPSNNPAQHFIKTIKIFQNGKEVFSKDFSGQEAGGQKTVFSLSGLKKTNKIKVWAACSVYGQLGKEFSLD
jgi:desulfoferrodoxin (superoxide reductase-like protein)